MNLIRKLRFWKRKRNDKITTRDIGTNKEDINSEAGTQVSPIELVENCHIGTQVDSITTCDASTETSNVEEQSLIITDGGVAEKEKNDK
jgi:hypothetical protein